MSGHQPQVGDIEVSYRARKATPTYVGVVDRVRRVDPWVSSDRVWRCDHEHPTPAEAASCAHAAIQRGEPDG